MTAEYQPLRQAEKLSWSDGDDVAETEALELPRRSRTSLRSRLAGNCIWVVHALLLITSAWMLLSAWCIRSSTLQHVKEYSAWTPAADAIEYETVKYNLSTEGNRFVGAGPEVDKAWREISYDMGDQMIAPTDLSKLGMPESSLQVTHPDTGKQGYRVGVEVFHHLHCINLLRRVTYKDYYEPLGGEFSHGPEALQAHTDHCLEVLRVNAQCSSDAGVFTFYMIEGDPLAWPQLNSNHKCRNFDRIREWAVDNSVGNMEVLR